MAGHCKAILLLEAASFVVPVSAQLSTLTLPFQIILGLLIFMFSVPIICKILHLIRMQVNKIRNANLFGSNADPEYADDDENDGWRCIPCLEHVNSRGASTENWSSYSRIITYLEWVNIERKGEAPPNLSMTSDAGSKALSPAAPFFTKDPSGISDIKTLIVPRESQDLNDFFITKGYD